MNRLSIIDLISLANRMDAKGHYTEADKLIKYAEAWDDYSESGEEKYLEEEKVKAGIKLSELVYDSVKSMGNTAGFEISDNMIAETHWDDASLMYLRSSAQNILDAIDLLRPDL
jgi:hypothetical protein